MDIFNNDSGNVDLQQKLEELEDKLHSTKQKRKRRKKKGGKKKKLKKLDKKTRKLKKQIKQLRGECYASKNSKSDDDLRNLIIKESFHAAPKVLDSFLRLIRRDDKSNK